MTLGLYVDPGSVHLLEPHRDLLEEHGVRIIEEPGLDGFSMVPIYAEEG